MLLKKGFKKFGHEDVRTDYMAVDSTHKAPDGNHPELVHGPLNFLDGCLPAGTIITFKSSAIYLKYDDATKQYTRQDTDTGAAFTVPANTALPAIASETVDNSSVFLLAEDFYSNDNGFVYYIVDNVDNLEDRA